MLLKTTCIPRVIMAYDETNKVVEVQSTWASMEKLLSDVPAVSAHQSTETSNLSQTICAKVSGAAIKEPVFTYVMSGLDEVGPITGNCVLSSCSHSCSTVAKKESMETSAETSREVTGFKKISEGCSSEEQSDSSSQATGGLASTSQEHSDVALQSAGNACSIAQLDASCSILSSLCESLEPKKEGKASNENRESCDFHLSTQSCVSSGYSGHKSRANMNSNSYTDMSGRKRSIRAHEEDYTDMSNNLAEQSSQQIVVGPAKYSTQLTRGESSSTSGATAILKPTHILVNTEHNVENICATNDHSSCVVVSSPCGSTSSLKHALVNRNQHPSPSSFGVSSLHLNHKCLHVTEEHHNCREESQHFKTTNATAQSVGNNSHCVHSPSNHLGSCLHSQDLSPSQLGCLFTSQSHFQHVHTSNDCTSAPHGTRNSNVSSNCGSFSVCTPVNSCHCSGHYNNHINPTRSSDFNSLSRANNNCSHGHNNCGNDSLLLRDSFNPSCEVHGHSAVSAVHGFSPSSSPMPNIDSCSDGHQMALGSLQQFLPINAADIAVSWASNGNGGLSGFVYTTSGSRENSSHHCCNGRVEMCKNSHQQHHTPACAASPHISSSSVANHSGSCHSYQNKSLFTATLGDNTASGTHASHHCDSSSNNGIYGRRPHVSSSSIYGTTAGRECSAFQQFESVEALTSCATTSQQHRLAVPQASHNSTNSLIRPAHHLPPHYQNMSGSATSLHSSGSNGSGCGHWCNSCQVRLAQGSGQSLCNSGVGASQGAVGGCSSKAVNRLTYCSTSATQPSTSDMHFVDAKSSNSLDNNNTSPEPRRSLKNKMIQKLAKHRQHTPSSCKETTGSTTKKKKPAFPFLMTCLSLITKTPQTGSNVPSWSQHPAEDDTCSSSKPSEPVSEVAVVAPSASHTDPARENQSGSNSTTPPCTYAESNATNNLEGGAVSHCDAHPDTSLSQIPLTTLLGILPRNNSERELYPSDDEPRYTPDPVRGAASSNARHRANGTMPLNINSMLGLQMLLERSLRIDFSGPSAVPQERIAHHLERLNNSIDEDSACLSSSGSQRTVHTQVDYIHFLVPDLLSITSCSFYWGKMDRYEAERLLDKRPEGTFLLRDSAQEEYLFSVSFRRYGKSLHARIEQGNHKFSFDSHDPGVFASDTVCGLVEHYKDPLCCMFFEPMLTNPLCRNFPFPLQHLCRATICSNSTYDGINKLALPKPLRHYLKEYHYKQLVRVRRLDH